MTPTPQDSPTQPNDELLQQIRDWKTRQGHIDELLLLISARDRQLFERIRQDVIGEDDYGHSVSQTMAFVHGARDGLRIEERKALDKLEKEYVGDS